MGCKTKTSFPFNKLTMASCCVSLNLSILKRCETHCREEVNLSLLTSVMLDRREIELINHSQACSILAFLVQKYNRQTSDPAMMWGKERGLTKRLEIEPNKIIVNAFVIF